ncbi:MAG: alpha/beta hydrolase [Proteobacteria bacterium]|nr:alpha/beta hydrolase [Pseudomonadota bacterium]
MPDDQPYVRPDVAGFLAFLNSQEGPELSELPLDEARTAYLAMAALAEADPVPLAVIRDLECPGPAGPIPLRLYDPREKRGPGPVVMFFHGGGFVIGDLDSHHALCTTIAAELDLPVVAVHYRLAPESPYPAAADDCEAATRWVAGGPAELGRQVTGLIPMGDSAGGNLTLVTTQELDKKPAALPIVLQVPLYPATDESQDGSMAQFAEGHLLTRAAMDWFMGSYAAVPGEARAYPLNGDLKGSPPAVLVTAGLDPLRDQGRRYAAKLIAAGTDVSYMERPGTIHGFFNLRKAVPSAQADTLAVLATVRLKLSQL